MIKAVISLIIASAGLWISLPAAAQFEIDPDHFGEPAPTVVQPRHEQSKGSMRASPGYKQAQRRRVQAFEGTKSPANTFRTVSSAAAVQPHRVSGTSRVARGPADRKVSEQSQLAPSHRLYGWVPQ
jgi:hypothetical protein